MKSMSDTLNEMAESWHQRIDDEQRAECEDILDAAEQVSLGSLPVAEFARLSKGRQRFVALMSTPKEDPRREPLLRAIDAVLRLQGLELTTSGIWDRTQLGMSSSLGPMRIHPAPSGDPWNSEAA